MNFRNCILAGITGGVMYFLLGWLLYGNLFAEQTKSPMAGVSRDPDQLVMWALAVGNLLFGFVLAYIFQRANVKTATGGMVMGTIVGFLFCLAVDLTIYGTTNIASLTQMAYDVAIFTAMSSLTGAGVGFVLSWGTAKETAAATS